MANTDNGAKEQERAITIFDKRCSTIADYGRNLSVLTEITKALRRQIDPALLVRTLLTEIKADEKQKLALCTTASLFKGLITVTQLGLELGKHLRQAYLVPFKNKGVLEAQVIIGYGGLVALAYRTRLVASIETHLVYAQDDFDLDWGREPPVKHRPLLDSTKDRGRIVGVWGKVHTVTGGVIPDFMSGKDIADVRTRSKAPRGGPWDTDEGEMTRKTLLRRITKQVPASIEDPSFHRAIALNDATDAGEESALFAELTLPAADDSDLETVDVEAYAPSKSKRTPTQERADRIQQIRLMWNDPATAAGRDAVLRDCGLSDPAEVGNATADQLQRIASGLGKLLREAHAAKKRQEAEAPEPPRTPAPPPEATKPSPADALRDEIRTLMSQRDDLTIGQVLQTEQMTEEEIAMASVERLTGLVAALRKTAVVTAGKES